MAKSSTKTTWGSKLNATWVVLGISLFVNAILISFIVFANSKHGDYFVLNHALNNVCIRDYSDMMQPLDANQKITFSEGLCNRNATTGADLNAVVVNGHVVHQPMQ